MALVFIDGQDHYTDPLDKWTSYASGSASVVAGGGRYPDCNALGIDGVLQYTIPAALNDDFVVVGFALKIGGGANFFAQGSLAVVLNSSSFSLSTLYAVGDGSTGFKLRVYAGNTVNAESAGAVLIPGSWHYVEYKASIADSGGDVEIKVDGVSVAQLTGDTRRVGGAADVQRIWIVGTGSLSDHTFAGSKFCDFYVLNGQGSSNVDYLGDSHVATLYPDADGANTGMTPSSGSDHYAMVDGVPYSPGNYVSGVSPNKDTFDVSTVPPLQGVPAVAGVQVTAVAKSSDGGAISARAVTRVAGTDYTGTTKALTGTFEPYCESFDVNPGTSVAWTESDVNAAEFGQQVQ